MKINVLQVPFADIFNKYQTEVAAGGGPDMFVAPNDSLGDWVRADMVLALDDMLAGKLDGVSQTGVDGMKVDGKLYGVPESAKAVAFYYNKSMVDKPPTTTDELLQMVKDGKKLQLYLGAYHMFGLTGAFGGKLLDENGACIADQAGWAEAMQYVLDLKAAGAIVESDYAKAETPFRQGQAAMFLNGPWALGDYKKDLGDNLGVVMIPSGPGGKANPLNGIDGFYVNPNSQNPQAAVDLALFLSGKDSAQVYTDKAGHVPIRSDVKAADPLVSAFAEASASGFPRPQSEEFAQFWTPFGDAWTKVIEGASTPADAVKAACAAMNAATGKTPSAAAPAPAVALAPVTGEVTLWNAYQTGSAEETTLAELIKNAQAANPDAKINVLQVPFADIFNKYQTEVAAGGGPDMFVAPNDSLGDWVRADMVLALDDKLAGKLDGVSQTGVDGMKVDGKLYGVPESAKAVALYYNKSMVDNPPKTTDELLQMVKDGKKLQLYLGAYHMFGLTGEFGGKLLDENGKCVADQAGWAEAMQYVLDLKKAGAIVESDYAKAETPFRQGQAAMFLNGPWALGDYKKDLGDNLGVVMIPSGPGGKANPLNGIDGFYVNPNSKNPDGAVNLALFLTGKDSAQIYTDKAGHVPIRSDVKAADPLVSAFAEASASGFPRPQSEEFAQFWTPFGDAWTKVIEGASTPADAVKAACAAMNKATGK